MDCPTLVASASSTSTRPHLRRPHRSNTVQPQQQGNTRGSPQPSVAVRHLPFQINALISRHYKRRTDLGPQSSTRLRLAQYRLAKSSWAQYSRNLKPFLKFLDQHNIPFLSVTDTHLERYVCYLHDSPTHDLAPPTLNSYLSAIRTCFREIGVNLNSHHQPTAAAVIGYQHIYRSTHPSKPQQMPWPTGYSCHALDTLRDILATSDIHSPLAQACSQIVFATLTFCREISIIHVRISDCTSSSNGITFAIARQKRPLANTTVPTQHHPFRHPETPSSVLANFVHQLSRTQAPSSLIWPNQRINQSLKIFSNIFNLGSTIWQSKSLRIGAATTAHLLGMPVAMIMQRMAHRSQNTTFKYIRPADIPSVTSQDAIFFWFPNLGTQ